jgi:hypothetical protein
LLGRYDEGAAHYEHAIAKETAVGAVLALLDSQAGSAHLLRLRNGPGDRARAESLRARVRAHMGALAIRRNWILDAFDLAGPEN